MQPTLGSLSADYKAPGGKLIRVRMTVDNETGVPVIREMKITGDFFMHPEEAIEDLETRLTGAPLVAEEIAARVGNFFQSDVEVIGANANDVVAVILAAQ